MDGIVDYTTIKDNRAFTFLKNSGKKRLAIGNYKGALSEFKLAQNIRPNSLEINRLLLETIEKLCEKNTSYCKAHN